ncbi:unnamed protein product [Linum trigynum]|uniref:Uncharacterized protein n=1 Tax=Linum trigynum TaxID=586398 RepID=A0AAV2F807_9ROSI
MRKKLKTLNREAYSDISTRARELETQLEELQMELLASPSAELVEAEGELAQKCFEVRKAEESFYNQKARTQGVQEGDMNTAYFHRTEKIHTHKQQITQPNIKEMGRVAVDFYR